jgi:hypothetical protein
MRRLAPVAFVPRKVGFVLPLVTRSDGTTTTLADGFSIGFPTGITLKGPGRLAFDMELVPSIQKSPRSVSLTVHPGFVEAVGRGFAVGMRAAFVVNSSTYGFTPLVNKSWPIERPGLLRAYFLEADLPVRSIAPLEEPPPRLLRSPCTSVLASRPPNLVRSKVAPVSHVARCQPKIAARSEAATFYLGL